MGIRTSSSLSKAVLKDGVSTHNFDDNTLMLPFEIWRESFLNDADLDLAKSSYAQLSPEPYQPLIEKLNLQQFYSLPIPKSYLYCMEDTSRPQQGEWDYHRMSHSPLRAISVCANAR